MCAVSFNNLINFFFQRKTKNVYNFQKMIQQLTGGYSTSKQKKNKKYHIVGTTRKSNIKIVEKGKNRHL